MKEIELRENGKGLDLTFWTINGTNKHGMTIALSARDVLELLRVLREGVQDE